MASLKYYEIKSENQTHIYYKTPSALSFELLYMKFNSLLIAQFLIIAVFTVGFLPGTSTPLSGEEVSEFDSLIDEIFGGKIRDENVFREKLERVRVLGASPQLIAEARMLFHLMNQDYEGISPYLPEIDEVAENWEPEESKVFRDSAGYDGLRSALHAYDARSKDDVAAFEKYSKEAFWHDPRLAPLLTTWIQDYRNDNLLTDLQVPMDMPIQQSDGNATTLGSLVSRKKAILLDFWATWCIPCVSLMPELIKKAEILEPQGVLVAGMNTETVEKAEQFRKKREINVTWLVEPEGQPLSRLLSIDSIPRMILIDGQGQVLFNGHPMDPSLIDALAILEVKL